MLICKIIVITGLQSYFYSIILFNDSGLKLLLFEWLKERNVDSFQSVKVKLNQFLDQLMIGLYFGLDCQKVKPNCVMRIVNLHFEAIMTGAKQSTTLLSSGSQPMLRGPKVLPEK